MAGERQVIGGLQPREIAAHLPAIDRAGKALAEREGRHAHGRADQDVELAEEAFEIAIDPCLLRVGLRHVHGAHRETFLVIGAHEGAELIAVALVALLLRRQEILGADGGKGLVRAGHVGIAPDAGAEFAGEKGDAFAQCRSDARIDRRAAQIFRYGDA